MRIHNEDALLKEDFRADIIAEIENPENQNRKDEAYKRYEVFKDRTSKYVLERMEAESAKNDVIAEIKNRVSNVSFCRKIIDKRSLVYKEVPERSFADNEVLGDAYLEIADLVNLDSEMKKTNKYVELFKNCMVQVVPYQDVNTERFKLKLSVLPPYLYDVIEDHQNPEMARVVIFSYYSPENSTSASYKAPGKSGNREAPSFPVDVGSSFRDGDGINQRIADSPADASIKKNYVWWSTKYHFTTNEKGEVIPGMQEDDLTNPIGELPFIDFSQDKDGQYWAVGGEDLVEGSILLNMLLSDLYYIAKLQGMGIFYMAGKGIPKNLEIGPSSGVFLEKENSDDPDLQIGYASSNPPIESHLRMIEQYLAFLLSTNNLDAGSVNGTLQADGAQSGIQEIIKKAELIEDIIDQQEMYKDNEPQLYRIIAKYLLLFKERGLLEPRFEEVGSLDVDARLMVKHIVPQPFMSEKEKLEIMTIRKDLGLDTIIDSIMRDNPGMGREEALAQFRVKMQEKLMESSMRLKQMGALPVTPEEEEEDGEEDNIQN